MAWDLEAILEFEMDEMQGKAFKLALLWEALAEKEFPGYQHVRLRKSGDPRKSHLFRLCYKLVRDTKGLIPDREYRLYILAQLHVLKHVGENVLIDPNILIGDKAWNRWKLWKYHYDRNLQNYKQTTKEAKPVANLIKIAAALKSSKDFLTKKFNGQLTLENINKSLGDHSFVRWVTMQRVSPFYVLLSPWVSKVLEGKSWDDVFLFDLSVYKDSLTEDAKKLFTTVFPDEV